jgi:hypothetical protein
MMSNNKISINYKNKNWILKIKKIIRVRLKNICKKQANWAKYPKPSKILKTRNPWNPRSRSNQEVESI